MNNKDRSNYDYEDDEMGLTYSPDEDIFYWERFSDWKQSQAFDYAGDAFEARTNNQIVWK